ncbi:hypothetical protein CHELA1G2_13489 [Hyphomicrobiales bacterium]|nr:hypothetical protein CHELA1G2_13489 [Hyphomicrobiales bacterium]
MGSDRKYKKRAVIGMVRFLHFLGSRWRCASVFKRSLSATDGRLYGSSSVSQ